MKIILFCLCLVFYKVNAGSYSLNALKQVDGSITLNSVFDSFAFQLPALLKVGGSLTSNFTSFGSNFSAIHLVSVGGDIILDNAPGTPHFFFSALQSVGGLLRVNGNDLQVSSSLQIGSSLTVISSSYTSATSRNNILSALINGGQYFKVVNLAFGIGCDATCTALTDVLCSYGPSPNRGWICNIT